VMEPTLISPNNRVNVGEIVKKSDVSVLQITFIGLKIFLRKVAWQAFRIDCGYGVGGKLFMVEFLMLEILEND